MPAVALSVLRTRVRERADMVGSAFVADVATGLDAWINEGVQRLHGKLVDAFGDEYVESTSTFNTVAGTSDYNLPTGFFRLYGVDLSFNGTARTLLPYTRAERNALTSSFAGAVYPPWYRVVGGKLRLLPVPAAVYAGTIYYAPEATLLVNAGDTITVPNGWEAYVVLYAAIQSLLKEESDARGFQSELQALDTELVRLRDDRDSAFPKSAVDMDNLNSDWRG
jgi:hypothetical protein